jgi:DNA-binding MurR/RpiR family transcriptional regulator
MPGVTARIKSLYRNLPKAERKIADFVLKNPQKVPFISVYDIAEAVEVSVASVSRFVREAGYPGFKNFKVELAKDAASVVPEMYGAITQDDSDETIVRKVFIGNKRSIEDTLKIINLSDFIDATKEVLNAEKIAFFGIGSSGNIAKDAALRFSHLDIQADAYVDPVFMLIQAKRLKEKDVAIGISHSGRSVITVEALRISKDNKAKTIGVSNYLKSPLSRYSKYFFCTSFSENSVKAAALSSRIAQMCLIDALYLLVARHKEGLWDIETLDSMAEKVLRIDG